MKFNLYIFVLLWGVLRISLGANVTKTKLHFMGFSYKYRTGDMFSQHVAMQYAAELINQDERILPKHEIVIKTYHVNNPPGLVMKDILDLKNRKSKQRFQFAFGPYTVYNGNKLLLPLQNVYSMPSLNDDAFESLGLNNAYKLLLTHFGWKRVAILYKSDHWSDFNYARQMYESLSKEGIDVVLNEPYIESTLNLTESYKLLKKTDTRIILLPRLTVRSAISLFCEVYRHDLFAPKYQFIVEKLGYDEDMFDPTRIDSQILQPNTFGERCKNLNESSLKEIIKNIFVITRSHIRLDNKITVANKTAQEIWESVKEHKKTYHNKFLDFLRRVNYRGTVPLIQPIDSLRVFDHVYQVALAFDRLFSEYNETDVLINGTYDKVKADRIMAAVKSTRYVGASGNFEPDLKADLLINQVNIANMSYEVVGKYYAITQKIEMFLEDRQLLKGVSRVYDKIPTIQSYKLYKTYILYTIWGIVVLEILFALVMFFFNNRYKNIKVLKMSSPAINNIIIVGCVLCYLSVLLYGMDSRYLGTKRLSSMCNVVVITLSIGFSLAFGALFGKTWRVYKIFASARHNKKMKLKDYHIVLFVLILLCVDVCMFLVWMFVSPFETEDAVIEEKIVVSDDRIYQSLYHQCTCQHRKEFFIPLFSIKGTLLLLGAFVGWMTRNVNIPVLNDAGYIGIAVYTVVVTTILGTISAIALHNEDLFNEGYIVVAITVCVATTVTMAMVIGPKLLLLFGKKALQRQRTMSSSSMCIPNAAAAIYKAKYTSTSSRPTSPTKGPQSPSKTSSPKYNPENMFFNKYVAPPTRSEDHEKQSSSTVSRQEAQSSKIASRKDRSVSFSESNDFLGGISVCAEIDTK